MPELKRTFQAGKMNRTETERLVRPGEYTEALNINIGRSESNDVGSIENIKGTLEISPVAGLTIPINAECIGSYRDDGNDRIYYFLTDNDDQFEGNPATATHLILQYDQNTETIKQLVTGNYLNFHKNYLITGIAYVDELLFWTDDRNEPRKINVTRALNDPTYYRNEYLVAFAKTAPIAPPTVTSIDTEGNTSTFLEEKFVRFAYRYKFNDGEYSVISPLTPIVFKSITQAVIGTNDYAAGQIATFINQAKRITLNINVPTNRGITAVEVLYNESSSTNMYILEELAAQTEAAEDAPDISLTYTYESQDPFRALPSSQITRVYDAIPRKAKSLEVAGGRIVFGNYLQNYNLPAISFEVTAKTIANNTNNQFNRHSVKSRRTYQVGIVLGDKYGRLSPVILSSTGNDTLFVDPRAGQDAMQQLSVKINSDLPDWAYSYRIVVKQRQQEYYNWFYPGIPEAGIDFTVSGNNINKVPRDTTDETVFVGNTAVAQSITEVYPKLDAGNNTNNTSSSVLQVDSIRYGASDGLPRARVYATGLTGFNGVFETSPRESNLDIFYETSTAGLVPEGGQITDDIDVDFYNCYVVNVGTNGHLELNRIKAGFNKQWFNVGLKAYATSDNFAERRRFNTLIHSSSFFNSRVGLNNINQFNEAEGGLTLSLDPADGSIQKLYAEDTLLIICQEDKISRSPIDKDFVYTAEGGAIPVTSSTQYLGTISPYAGEYGISTNPESFAVYGTRKYFADKNRGVILRLGGDGLTEISQEGMIDFFRDALRDSTKVLGSYDEFFDQYNVTIVGPKAYGGFKDTNVATGKDGYFTVSWEEETRGWVSFKSFQQEAGTTINNRYYTMNGGKLWEHHINPLRNYFYDTHNPSYVEVIFNDSPSDVKEFKTINYEGNIEEDNGDKTYMGPGQPATWRGQVFDTEIEEYRFDPNEDALSEVYTMTLNVTENVTDGRVRGIDNIKVVKDENYVWTIKVSPSTSEFLFQEPVDEDATLQVQAWLGFESDDTEIEGVWSEGDIYFVVDPVEPSDMDRTFNVIIKGAAGQDVSGAILTIAVGKNFGEDNNDIEVAIPTQGPFASQFRAGNAAFSYRSTDQLTDMTLGISSLNSLYEIRPEGIGFDITGIGNLLDGDAETALIDGTVFYRQKLTLPSIGTRGQVTVQNVENQDVFAIKPLFRFNEPTRGGDTLTYTVQWFNEETAMLEVWSGPQFAQRVLSGASAISGEAYVVPNFNEENIDEQYIIPTDAGITISGNDITEHVIRITGQRGDLIGAYEFELTSVAAEKTESRTDTSKDRDISWNVVAETEKVGDLQLTIDQEGNDIPLTDTINLDDGDVTFTIGSTIFIANWNSETTNFRLEDSNNVDIPKESGVILANSTASLVVDNYDDLAPGTYSLTITPRNPNGYNDNYRGDETQYVPITINLMKPEP